MDKTTPMKSKPLVDVTCKLGTKGCFEDGRCHALGNCENKITTHADRIRAMSDEELAKWIDWLFGRCEWCDTDKMATDDCNDVECTSCILEWLKQPAEEGSDNG